MKVQFTTILFIVVIVFLFSCERARRNTPANDKIAADSKPEFKQGFASGSYSNAKTYSWAPPSDGNGNADENRFISSSAAVESGKDTTHRFIRTADMKFRVKDVYHSSLAIEDITRHFNGFVTSTNISSNIDNTTVTPVSSDSSLESIFYTITNAVTLGVPNVKLDSTLRAIAGSIDYLNYRKITAEDVAPQLLADWLKQNRLNRHNYRLSTDIDKGSHKLSESTEAEQAILDKDEEADNTKLNSLSLNDKIKFSTVYLDIYQRPSVKRQIIANDKNIKAYEPPLGSQLADAFKTGWKGLYELILTLITIWPLVIIVVVAFVAYKMWRRNRG